MNIRTWQERIVTANPPYVDPEEINKAMLEEIDELRAKLELAALEQTHDQRFVELTRLRQHVTELELQEPYELEWPDYHPEGRGCGLEDRNITGRYEAMRYGWEQALEHVAKRLPERLFLAAGAEPNKQVIEELEQLKAKLAALEAQKIPAAIAAALSNCENLAIASGAHEAYRVVGQAFNKLRATIAAGAAPVPRMTGAALASQEPVAEVLLVDGEKVIDASMAFFDSVELGAKLYLAAGAAPVPNAELAEALEDLMIWQVKNVKRWHNSAYDNAARVLKKLEAGAAPAAKVPEEPRIDINDLSGMIAAVIKEQP